MFKRRRSIEPSEGAGHGVGLRKLALELQPEAIGLAADEAASVWGLVMDTVMADGGWHCLVVLGDGTTSLYTSSAFGVIGAGAHPAVHQASDTLLGAAESALDLFTPVSTTSLPGAGHVALRALTFRGHAVVTAPEDDLGHGRHPASSVFHAAHAVIAEVRRATPR